MTSEIAPQMLGLRAAPRRFPLGQVSVVSPVGMASPVPSELRAEIDRAITEHGAAVAEWLNADAAWSRLWETTRGAGRELPPGVVGANPLFEAAYMRAWRGAERVNRARDRLRRLEARASAIERIAAGRFHGVRRGPPYGPAVPTVPGTRPPPTISWTDRLLQDRRTATAIIPVAPLPPPPPPPPPPSPPLPPVPTQAATAVRSPRGFRLPIPLVPGFPPVPVTLPFQGW